MSYIKSYLLLSTVDTSELEYNPGEFVCVDFTKHLIKTAAEEGYRVYLAPIFFVTSDNLRIVGAHLMCSVIVSRPIIDIGSEELLVAIEPQTLETTIIGVLRNPEQWVKKWIEFLP